jgi:uncharacterized protein YjbI with pentapeptide repeats
LRTSRHPAAVANALTALNTAGVSFSGMNLAGIGAGSAQPPAPAAGTPFADLGGAMLAGVNLSRADLRNCRLQQACLDGADLRHADIRGALFGELPSFLVGSPVSAVAVSPDGRFVYSGSSDKTVKQWETSSGAVRAVAWRCCCAVCDVAGAQLVRTILLMEGHSDLVWAVAVSPDGRFVYSGSYDKTVKQWEASDGAVRAAASRCGV